MTENESPDLEMDQEAETQEVDENEKESAPSENEADENAASTSEDDEGEEDSSEDAPKRKSGFEKRVEKLNARAREAQLEAEFWKSKAMGNSPKAEAPPAPVEKPKFSDYNDIEAYSEALTEWKLDTRLQQYEVSKKQQQATATYEERVQKVVSVLPDFYEVIDDAGHVPISPGAIQAITESELGPLVAYELARNVSEAERISRLSPARQIAEIGRIEERVSRMLSENKKSEAPAKKATTSAPAPIKPAAGKGAVKTTDLSDPNLDFADFKKLREAQLKAKRR